jgi:hypothetical protein
VTLYRRGRMYSIQLWVDGVRHLKSTGTNNRREAETIEREFREELNRKRHQIREASPDMTFADLAARFLADGSPRPYHLDRFKVLLPYFGEFPIGRISKPAVREYRAARRKQKPALSETTLNRDVEALRHVLYWAVDEGFLNANPLARIRLSRPRRKPKPILGLAEEDRLLPAPVTSRSHPLKVRRNYMKHVTFVLVCVSSICMVAQNPAASDPVAISLALRSVSALTRGANITDVTLNASVTSILGSDNETGTGTFQAKGRRESRVSLNLSDSTRDEVRNAATGVPRGAWKKDNGTVTAFATHNCWTDAAWFFPAFSSLTQAANPNFVFQYMGQEEHGGVNTQHVQVFQPSKGRLLQHLSIIDFYLDPASSLPLAIAFQAHPDKDAARDVPEEVRFADYQAVGGILVPFHIQRMLNGDVILDITVTSATFNSGLPDSMFTLQ